jgi:hypothetical protein
MTSILFGNVEMSSKRSGRAFKVLMICIALFFCFYLPGCKESGGSSPGNIDQHLGIVVNSLEDSLTVSGNTVTLRAAVDRVEPGETISFDPSLNGKTIRLRQVGSFNTVLKGEMYLGMQFQGYQERDYGRSALYARKTLNIDASRLPAGITISWDGGDANPARVLAVYGDLTMKNVAITSGLAVGETIFGGTQPFTLARGGGVAVWGTARLDHCILSGNRVRGDLNSSRDRGAFGGGIYGNQLILSDCIISGNSAFGYGAAGGGVYSVGGVDMGDSVSSLTRCTISGNRTTAQHSYGGGVFSEGGGPGNMKTIVLANCTIARNLVEDNPGLPEPLGSQYYYRGGGFYMTNGSLSMTGCTVAENRVTGIPAIFSNKPNMGGGGLTATIGNAHVVDKMEIQHSIIAGNLVNGASDDVYTGSLLNFYSYGYNLIGTLNFSQILVPIPPWWSLSRKHWPKVGDQDGVDVAAVLSISGAKRHASIISVGADQGEPVVLWYPPQGAALNRIPLSGYRITYVSDQYSVISGHDDDFLEQIIGKLRTDYAAELGSDFGKDLNTSATWQGTDGTWPAKPENAAWIKFWRDLDLEIGDRLGIEKLGDGFWGSFVAGPFGPNVIMEVWVQGKDVTLLPTDQLGRSRSSSGEIGAIEQ